ncbi:MAG: hypothetical protein QOD33_1027 [Pyrinomonadaceae bacterium]|jgi:hypothetical protein|nr:hypothetical protein [Pyrinomonadaceae bacterium]
MSTLHLHNGDAAADIAKESSLAGEHLAWRESLVTGPTPAGLSATEWQRVRAKHLAESYGVPEADCERQLARQEAVLAAFSDYEEVVLWFEHDLFCQVHLLYLLDRYSRQSLRATKLSLICIGSFPGKQNFRGLGELSPTELASLFPSRTAVTEAQLLLATAAWAAYSAAQPTGLEKIIKQDTSALAFLRAALLAQFARFPSVRNGLGRIENRALDLIAAGANTFAELFTRFGETETIYGFGDAQFWLTLRRLNTVRNPLLTIAGSKLDQPPALTPDVIGDARFSLTDVGHAVRTGDDDFVALNGIDLWLGGVHLHDQESLWRWNEQSRTLVFSGDA